MSTVSPMETVARQARAAATALAATTNEQRRALLAKFKEQLLTHKNNILAANAEDCKASCGCDAALLKRLVLTEGKLADCLQGIDELIAKEDPIGVCDLATELADGLQLYRVSCPIGVLAVIFEARPEAAIQIASLALRSGNAVILKGGREATKSVHAIYEALQAALTTMTPDVLHFAATVVDSREDIAHLLSLDQYIDLVIPRGSNALVRHIKGNTKIPVLGHADGLCSVYVDAKADLEMAAKIVKDAKTDYPAACNACETLLVHNDIAHDFLPRLAALLAPLKVKYYADRRALPYLPGSIEAVHADFDKEFLSLELAVKCVDSLDDAVTHINTHGSHHTDVIVTNDQAAADAFLARVDSAGVYHNASSRFADGYRYGFGAEVGISTNRIHARGPVGLEGLLIYKYKLFGSGHTVGDIASGAKKFTHKPLKVPSEIKASTIFQSSE